MVISREMARGIWDETRSIPETKNRVLGMNIFEATFMKLRNTRRKYLTCNVSIVKWAKQGLFCNVAASLPKLQIFLYDIIEAMATCYLPRLFIQAKKPQSLSSLETSHSLFHTKSIHSATNINHPTAPKNTGFNQVLTFEYPEAVYYWHIILFGDVTMK